jgi:ATP-dependent DNA helicase RecQ
LLYRYEDFDTARYLSARGVSSGAVIDAATALAAGQPPQAPTRQQTAAIAHLADLGAVTWEAEGGARWSGAMTLREALKASDEKLEREGEVERSRLRMMRNYAEHSGCRRSFLLTYFGQDYQGPCGNCDNDLAQAETPDAADAGPDVPFRVGTRVVSERWGEGSVQRYDGDQVTVLFDEHGYRELYLPVVLERGLLRPAGQAPAAEAGE